ncbi:metal-dependent hydrolase [Macrococcus armenti]|uniref:metal-dependent hydrolase n=1 Tax=Macrococcus armenti TaxID=2875764 RepID=UPI001CCE3EB8|nr:metal-dependent hydrolase [Macrococcus armenti]UBH08188.1 metal-dependent hydrolase [Macrococcus armenti]UBH10419.1 metal-dependent hydrolase [Macrococcus armenti]
MDTATHVVMGVALAGLSTIDPAVTSMYPAVVTTVMIGSQIPDIDTVLKLRNNAVYITHHRGITHSIPFTILWPILLTIIMMMVFHVDAPLHLWLWAQIAVFLHVFVDIFNSYGTQALRPLTKKWIQIGIINTFDLFIFVTHIIAIFLWYIGFNPVYTFGSLYLILIVYYIIRRILQQTIKKNVLMRIPKDETVIKTFVAPTIKFFEWRIAVQTDKYDYIGRSYKGSVHFSDRFVNKELPDRTIMQYAKHDNNLRAFLNFSSIYRYTVKETNTGYELRFIDLRYLKDGHYSFVAILSLDNSYHVTHSYTGWVFSEGKLQKKLEKGKL